MADPLWDLILEALRRDPDLREAVRQQVLEGEWVGVPKSVDGLVRQVQALTEMVAALTSHLQAVEDRPPSAPEPPPDLSPMAAEIEALAEQSTEMQGRLDEVDRQHTIVRGEMEALAAATAWALHTTDETIGALRRGLADLDGMGDVDTDLARVSGEIREVRRRLGG